MEIDKWVGGYKVRSFPWVDNEHIYFNVQVYRPGQSLSQKPIADKSVFIVNNDNARRMVEQFTDSLAEFVARMTIPDGGKVVIMV